MDIALVAHSYHRITESNRFFITVLEQIGTVTLFWDDSWMWRDGSILTSFDPSAYDIVVIWQWSKLLVTIPSQLQQHRNVVIVPMHDMVLVTPSWVWTRVARRFKILCFSIDLFRTLSAYTSLIHRVKYYPDPAELPSNASSEELSGFFWQRCNQITGSTISTLCNGTTFSLFTIHEAPDPGIANQPNVTPSIAADVIERSSWYQSRYDYLSSLSKHQVFFAPRLHEGIGLAFLEAMAMGLCVIAPNTPTHNEYISDNVNGLLYDQVGQALHFHDASRLGRQASSSIQEGHALWLASIDEMLYFIATPLTS